ncbi:ras association domain-containing protein 5 isoform X1 [Seriola lalandi dorsalis]|uniref:Ras association domain family member 5 n=1 Tax=Seriola lalandi dorsalis TaxID=1841481 RepID=A0A3B4WW68_SERLL|nr:ras association domain-containing protein 5 isoform X1 [Seriola lalandi dorsalis]XP_056256358.1 ras association domain-containing protein 5 isoform X1 [Seriola aureovittata]
MASASVVGQHPGQHFKLPGVRKKITPSRRFSREKMMFRRSGGECGSVTTEGELETQPLSQGPAGDTAVRAGMMPSEGCGAPAAPAAPRSPNREREEGSTDCVGHTATGSLESQRGHITGDRNSNIDCDSNHNTGARRGTSLKRSGINVMTGDLVAGGHKGADRHRDAPHGRRDSRNGDSGHRLISSSSSLPLGRLTQGKTGVVKLARTEPSRREAWSIFPPRVDPRVRTEKGEGHRFDAKPVTQDWCDACSRKITAQALKCQNCSYTCHLECQSQVQLDCNQKDRQPEKTPSPRSNSSPTAPQHKQNETKEEEARGTKDLSEKEVQTRIKAYNSQVTENGMKLASDGSYTGFIKVHLRLSRPVTVPAVDLSGSEDQEGTDCEQSEKRSSFYIPRECVKQLHISSLTTTREVIQGLLKKFMVLDNPRKFALYRQTHRDGQDLFQKLPLPERPLLLRLIAGPDPQQLSFVLKENETGEVEWHAFSVPELQNFLVILEKEEAERVRAVKQKYTMYRQKLQQALQQHDP